jgi:glycosyltransferase involved in cell wall biosynthesis
MPSVLFLSLMNSAAWGGSEEIWYKSALYLAKKNYKVGISCFNWPGKEEKLQQLTNAGCELFLLPGRNETTTLIGKFKLRNKLRAVPFKNYERVIVNQGGWKDVVHGPFKKLNFHLPPYSLLFHNYDENELLSDHKKKLFTNWVQGAEKNIGAAEKIFSVIKKNIDADIPDQQVLFNPISFQSPENFTPFIISPHDKLVFTMLAELDIKRKAQDQLINTLSADKWANRNFELNFYGSGKDHSYLENLIIEKKLSSKIFLRGFTKNVQEALTGSHVILQLTHFDAMPIAVTEALAVSRAIIVSNVGDMPLWVKDDLNGWVAPQATINDIDLVLEKAWQKRSQLEEMGKESFRIFKQKYPADPIGFFLKQAGIKVS